MLHRLGTARWAARASGPAGPRTHPLHEDSLGRCSGFLHYPLTHPPNVVRYLLCEEGGPGGEAPLFPQEWDLQGGPGAVPLLYSDYKNDNEIVIKSQGI